MMPTLGQHLLESTIFAVLVSICALAARHLGPSARHAVWLAAAAKFAVPAAVFSWLGIQLESILPVNYSPALSQGVFGFLAAPGADRSGDESIFLTAIVVVWASGAFLMSIVWIRRSLLYRRGFEYPADVEQKVVDRFRQRLRISRPVGLRASASSSSELGLWGLWHPTIKIPRGLSSQLTPSELEAVLLHELAHVRRWDNLTAAFVHTLVCLFWFHPLLWWIEKQLLNERERACDETVVSCGTAPETYVTGILKVCRFQVLQAVAGTSGIAGSDLKNRMELIMSNRLLNPHPRAAWALSGLLGAAMTIIPFVGGFLQQSAVHAQEPGCMYNSIEYPRGTVLQMGKNRGAPKRLCSQGRWESTDRAATAVAEDGKAPAPTKTAVCTPAPSKSANACACQDGPYSLGAIVNTRDGKMRCDKFVLGQYTAWRPATPSDLGVK